MFKIWRVAVVIFLAGRLLAQETRRHRARSRRQWPFQDKEGIIEMDAAKVSIDLPW